VVTDVKSKQVFPEEGEIIIKFQYDTEIISEVREITGRRWDPDRKVWKVPIVFASAVIDFARKWDFDISPNIVIQAKDYGQKKEILSPWKIDVNGKDLKVVFPYDPVLVNAVRQIPGRTYCKPEQMWTVPASSSPYIYNFVREINEQYDDIEFVVTDAAKRIMGVRSKKTSSKMKERWRAVEEFIENKYSLPKGLYDHQIEGIKYIIANKNSGLFDEQGLGKTCQALISVDAYKQINVIENLLVVCPNSVKYPWLREIQRVFPSWYENDRVSIYDRSASKKTVAALREGAIVGEVPSPRSRSVFIINYESVARNKEKLAKFLGKKGFLVLDESQRTKNPSAQVTKAFIGEKSRSGKVVWEGIASFAKRKLIMTGTPIANKPVDAWAQLKIIGAPVPETFGKFRKTFCVMGRFGPTSYKNLNLLKHVIDSCSLRRIKSECLDLPPKVYQDFEVSMEPRQREMYEEMRDELATQILKDGEYENIQGDIIITKLLRLAQIASNPALLTDDYDFRKAAKFREIKRVVDDCTYSGQKVVIYTAFRKNIECLVELFKEMNPVFIIGGMQAARRQENIDIFQEDSSCKIMCLTSAGREGITLTAAQTLIFLDRDYNLVNYLQTQDRIHRIGQTAGTCVIGHMIASDSIDQHIRTKMMEKVQTAQFLQGDLDKISITSKITRTDLEEILLG